MKAENEGTTMWHCEECGQPRSSAEHVCVKLEEAKCCCFEHHGGCVHCPEHGVHPLDEEE